VAAGCDLTARPGTCRSGRRSSRRATAISTAPRSRKTPSRHGDDLRGGGDEVTKKPKITARANGLAKAKTLTVTP